MPVDFPNSPTTGQQVTIGTRVYQYDGARWVVVTTPLLLSTSTVDGGTPSTINFNVTGPVDAGGV
jgi:hypothetical protein